MPSLIYNYNIAINLIAIKFRILSYKNSKKIYERINFSPYWLSRCLNWLIMLGIAVK